MKIKRISTLSFAISEEREQEIEKRLKKYSKGGFFNLDALQLKLRSSKNFLQENFPDFNLKFPESRKENRANEGIEIIKTYLPIAKFRVTRIEDMQKGRISEASEGLIGNYFHIDLSSGETYCIDRNNRIVRYDIFRRLVDLSPEAVKTLGYLFMHGETYMDELDQNVVFEIARRGLIRIFKPGMLRISAFIEDEISGSGGKIEVKDRVKVAFHIPRFDYQKYNLLNLLTTTNTIVESYKKEPIRFSVEQLSKILEYFFYADVSLEAIIFMPSMRCEYMQNQSKRISKPEFPICFSHEKFKKCREGIKLTPISLSTELLAAETIPIERSTTNFSDVAGLDDVKDEIRKEIIYPLIRPDLAKEFGRKGGGNILLYGPPGCGKTYMAKATIGECGASFFNVNMSDIIKSGVENGARILHEIFTEACKNSPSIVFIDEIDAIGGKKSNAGYVEKIFIDQLFTEMDGVESMNENVLFIAATNAPWAIEPAFRRSGRFTKQIFIPPPDLNARIEIFKIHTRDKPLSKSADFHKLAELTEDYASADIKAVCDAAAEIPWEEALKGNPEREITMADFLRAIGKQESSLIPWFKTAQKEIEKSGEAGLYEDLARYILKYGGGVDQVRKPDINFSDVGDLDEVKEEIRKRIIYPILKPDIAKNFEMVVGGGILLYGPPGCGKTYIATAAAGECNASFFNVKISDIISSLQGESEKMIHEIFERASRNTPAIIFFDEIDAILGNRESITGSEKRILAEFLTEMDGFTKNKDIMIIAATNSPCFIDPALRRSGRFTKEIFIPPPDLNARIEIFKIHTRNRPISSDVDFNKLAEFTEYYSSSDIKAICDAAAEIPWGEALKTGTEREITMADFLNGISKQKSSIPSWFDRIKKDIESYKEKEEFGDILDTIVKFEIQRLKKHKEILLSKRSGKGEGGIETKTC